MNEKDLEGSRCSIIEVLRTSGDWAEIWSECLPNTSQKRYLWTKLHGGWCPDQDSNRAPPEYKFEAAPLVPTCSCVALLNKYHKLKERQIWMYAESWVPTDEWFVWKAVRFWRQTRGAWLVSRAHVVQAWLRIAVGAFFPHLFVAFPVWSCPSHKEQLFFRAEDSEPFLRRTLPQNLSFKLFPSLGRLKCY